jgi:hypothetical protein
MTVPAKLDHLFSQVSSTYEHQQKSVRAGPALETADVYFKWSLIEPESLPITAEQVNGAQTFLLEELNSKRLKLRNEVGFVVQHRCAKVLILYVCTWRGDNEVWETLYHTLVAAEARAGQARVGQARAGQARYKVTQRQNTSPTFCVWVLPVVLHEQRAWVKYLESSRDQMAQEAYLNDQLTGQV